MPDPVSEEIRWFNPDPRAIIPLDGFHCSRSLARTIRKGTFTYTINQAFTEVMAGCADRPETWINQEFKRAYQELHAEGSAHSLEVWHEGNLAGGVYGVALGGAFFAESKFHRVRDASKVAIYHLVEHLRARGFMLLEVQFLIPHLASLGATAIPTEDYLSLLYQALTIKTSFSD